MERRSIDKEVYLSLIVPAYNEVSRRLAENLKEILVYLKAQPYGWELIVVDDGSGDQTASVAAQAAAELDQAITILRNDINRGKGYSVRRGVLAAARRPVFFFDADLTIPVTELDRALPLL